MTEYLRSVERYLGFSLPHELIELYKAIENAGIASNYLFNTRSASAHWLANANYFLIRPDDINSGKRGKYFINDFYVQNGKNTLEAVNREVGRSIKEYWLEDKIFVFGWSCEVVEKDASLVYIFDEEGGIKGIYIHSLNFVEDKVFIAKTLSEVFDLNMESYSHEKNSVTFKPRISNNNQEYQKALGDTYKIFDTETIENAVDYKYWLLSMSKLSKKKFLPTLKSASSIGSEICLEIEVASKQYSISLLGDTDHVDLEIVNFANRCLVDVGQTTERFIVFKDSTFGHEVGIAFASNDAIRALSGIKKVEILNH